MKSFAFDSTGSSFAIGTCQLIATVVAFIPFRNLIQKRLHACNRPSGLFWVFFLPSLVMSLGFLLGVNGSVDEAARLSPNLFGQIINLVTVASVLWMIFELGMRRKYVPR